MAIAVHILLLVALPPLLLGIVNRTKAVFAGRRGAPVWQPYLELWRLFHKGAVYSRTTTWLFRASPIISLATALTAGLLTPLAGAAAPLGFAGDVIIFAYLLGLGRFLTMTAALDTGSSFEGMGASREAAFSALAEPALFLALAIVCIPAGSASFERAWAALPFGTWGPDHPALPAAAAALFVVLLAENSRIPVDDPNTHLELTMVHEVMVLDHSGPDFAFILYGGAVKLFLFASLLIHILFPIPAQVGWATLGFFMLGLFAVGIAVGTVESITARIRLPRVPQFLIGASVIAALGLAVLLYRGMP